MRDRGKKRHREREGDGERAREREIQGAYQTRGPKEVEKRIMAMLEGSQ